MKRVNTPIKSIGFGEATLTRTTDLLKSFYFETERYPLHEIGFGDGRSAMQPGEQLVLSPDKAYIVTDGSAGLNIDLAQWLVDKGARKLVLLSRTDPKLQHDITRLQEMVSSGIRVDYEHIDLTFSQVVVNCIGRIRMNAPIGGVIHSAAVLRDITVPYMSEKVFYAVFVPKVVGAWNLHLALGDEPVDFFVNVLTTSAIPGLQGQAAYSSASKLIDELVVCRELKGLNAQSVNLGVLGQRTSECGRDLHVLESHGWTPTSIDQLTDQIERSIVGSASYNVAAGQA